MNVLTTIFWSAAVAKGCEPWFERVPSKANCSDAISRGDTKYAIEQGWVHCVAVMCEFWKTLKEALATELRDLPMVASALCTATVLQQCPSPT